VTVFVDTSAIYALLDRDDDGHVRALRGQELLMGEDLATHSYVLAEVISLVRQRLGPDATARLIDDFLPALRVVEVDEGLRARATEAYRNAVRSAVSFVDRTSFELMRQLGTSRAFALDSDFDTAGFVLVS